MKRHFRHAQVCLARAVSLILTNSLHTRVVYVKGHNVHKIGLGRICLWQRKEILLKEGQVSSKWHNNERVLSLQFYYSVKHLGPSLLSFVYYRCIKHVYIYWLYHTTNMCVENPSWKYIEPTWLWAKSGLSQRGSSSGAMHRCTQNSPAYNTLHIWKCTKYPERFSGFFLR